MTPAREPCEHAARRYLSCAVPHVDPVPLDAFLAHGDAAIRYLEQHTSVSLMPVATYPDDDPDLPGATLGGRVLEPVAFDARALGADFALLRAPLPEFLLFGGMMVSRQNIPHLRRATRSLRSAAHVARLLARRVHERLRAPRGTTLVLGDALAGRLLASLRRTRVSLATAMRVGGPRPHDGAVIGVNAIDAHGATVGLVAARGVVLATGGLSHGRDLRAAGASLTPPTSDGAFWMPASTFTRADGTPGVYPHTVADRAKPGLIAVDTRGVRFVNEAVSYHEFVRAQLRASATAIPAWLLCDARFLWHYGLGRVRPFTRGIEQHVRDGYLRRGASVDASAQAIGVPAVRLRDTVDVYNLRARDGRDPAFGRGGDAYQRHLGDAARAPNPCVAPLERAPFYALRVLPADLGMAAGIRTDAKARVLDAKGQIIAGLCACGNDMHSVMEGAYPAPGITLGPALTFGYLAGRDAAGRATA